MNHSTPLPLMIQEIYRTSGEKNHLISALIENDKHLNSCKLNHNLQIQKMPKLPLPPRQIKTNLHLYNKHYHLRDNQHYFKRFHRRKCSFVLKAQDSTAPGFNLGGTWEFNCKNIDLNHQNHLSPRFNCKNSLTLSFSKESNRKSRWQEPEMAGTSATFRES